MRVLKFISVLFILLGLATSCKKDDNTDYSSLNFNENALLLPQAIIVPEAETQVSIPIKFKSGIQITDLNFEVEVIGGSATEDEDYAILNPEFTLHAFEDSVTIDLAINDDIEFEEDETIFLRVREAANSSNLANSQDSVDIVVTITNSVYSALDFNFAWEDTVNIDDIEYNTCEEVDMDIYLLDEEGNDLGIYNMASTNCPEHVTLDFGNDAFVVILSANLYANYLRPLAPEYNRPLPITSKIMRVGGSTAQFTQSAENSYKVSSLDTETDEEFTLIDLVKVDYSGNNGVFMIYNLDNDSSYSLRQKSKKMTNSPRL